MNSQFANSRGCIMVEYGEVLGIVPRGHVSYGDVL